VRKLATFCGAPRSAPARFAHLFHLLQEGSPYPQASGWPPEILQLFLPSLLLLAHRLDLPKAVDELFFSVGDYLLQPLDIIYMAIQHILHVSKQLFFIC
jgi:hypothetical protein